MPHYPQFKTLGDVIEHHGEEQPLSRALVCEERITTYGELLERSRQVSRGLSVLTEAGARIAVLSRNHESYFELLFGAALAGRVLVPVNWRLAPPEIEYILNDAAVEVLFVDPTLQEGLGECLSRIPSLKLQLTLSEEESSATQNYAAWRNSHPSSEHDSVVEPEDVAVQMYTSGTTGRPKGVMLSHRAIMDLREKEYQIGEWSRWQKADVGMVAMPLFHIGGTATGLIALHNGASSVIVPEVDPGELIRLIETWGVTHTFLVPAAIQMVLEHPDCRPHCFSSLKLLLYGAAPIAPALLRQALRTMNCQFAQLYGMTETAGSMTVLVPEDHRDPDSERLNSCGRAYPGIELAIADLEGNRLAPGEIGEILIKTHSLMSGYWKLPDATGSAIHGQWYLSGDAGYLDEEGYLFICDRIKDMIVSGGENIYPAEIEAVLYEHPAVSEVAVIAVPSAKWGEEVMALVVSAETLDIDKLLAFARERLAGYKLPKQVERVSSLPRNASGKLLKATLREKYWQGHDRRVN